ncbi:hypothetical protein D3C72_1787480 [compost metagenome]
MLPGQIQLVEDPQAELRLRRRHSEVFACLHRRHHVEHEAHFPLVQHLSPGKLSILVLDEQLELRNHWAVGVRHEDLIT